MSRHYSLGSVLSGGIPIPRRATACEAWTNLYDRLPAAGAQDAPRIPHPLRHRRGARPQQRARRGDLPAQHRAGLHARSRAWSKRSARITAEEVRATGIQWTFAPVRDRAAGRALGPHLRGLLRRSATGRAHWARPRCAACRAHDLADPLSVLACAKHFVGDGGTTFGSAQRRQGARPGRHARGRSHAAPHPPAGLHLRDQGRRGHHHALLQQLERREVLRPQAPAHRHSRRASSASKAS